ncbi:dsDNA nuclease domain-containing protein [Oceanobacillus kimchii]|uniref:dsDNA nuclease domain-containing protein n=1 Tax=Oceanobacillus kimchii TaxID=746691 RepID=UPI003C78C47E
MVRRIIESDLREQAGSDSYNRFEYQVYWAVYYMIKQIEINSDFYVFCEFHDDIAKMDLSDNPQCAEFFQVKTTTRYKKWKIDHLAKTTKKKSGKGFKNSFLGFIFYNFLNFQDECQKCHFVSNIDVDPKIRLWQSIIEDKKILFEEEEDLYNEIRTYLRKEYEELEENTFNTSFNNFIQNTFIYFGELPLSGYEKVVSGSFFELLKNDNIYTSNSNKILKDIIEEVRKKSKTKIETPISFNTLKQKKGISSEVFNNIKEQIHDIKKDEQVYLIIKNGLKQYDVSEIKIGVIISSLKRHKRKLLDPSNKLYIATNEQLITFIEDILIENYDDVGEFEFIQKYIIKEVINQNESVLEKEIGFNKPLLEGLVYEQIFI